MSVLFLISKMVCCFVGGWGSFFVVLGSCVLIFWVEV